MAATRANAPLPLRLKPVHIDARAMITVPQNPADPKECAAASQDARASTTLEPGLYLVATPIGNLRDITLRALDVLGAADLVLAEDTRVSRKLFEAYGLRPPFAPYHEHNAKAKLPGVLKALREGARIALVSDAGTPLVSDPGFRLLRAAVQDDIAVRAIPGPSAALAALCISGLPVDRFLFAGFLPAKSAARLRALEALKAVPASLVFYESPARLDAALADMAKVLGPRPAMLARELTKRFESHYRAPLDQLAALVPKEERRGEMVLVVAPPEAAAAWSAAELDNALRAALARLSLKDAADEIAAVSGLSRRQVYQRALALQKRP